MSYELPNTPIYKETSITHNGSIWINNWLCTTCKLTIAYVHIEYNGGPAGNGHLLLCNKCYNKFDRTWYRDGIN
jgi:hypothetical protein